MRFYAGTISTFNDPTWIWVVQMALTLDLLGSQMTINPSAGNCCSRAECPWNNWYFQKDLQAFSQGVTDSINYNDTVMRTTDIGD